MSRFVAVALTTGVFVGADIAFAIGADETVRVPVGALALDDQSEEVIVTRGDHLWKISKRHLEERLDQPPSNPEIGPYWRKVIDQNIDNLRSGDPDLIYPGEVIEMPRVSLSEQR